MLKTMIIASVLLLAGLTLQPITANTAHATPTCTTVSGTCGGGDGPCGFGAGCP